MSDKSLPGKALREYLRFYSFFLYDHFKHSRRVRFVEQHSFLMFASSAKVNKVPPNLNYEWTASRTTSIHILPYKKIIAHVN